MWSHKISWYCLKPSLKKILNQPNLQLPLIHTCDIRIRSTRFMHT